MPFDLMTRVGPRYHALDWGPDPSKGRAIFGGKHSGPLQTNGTLNGACAKMAEPIDMPFWTKTGVGPWNHVVDGVQIPHKEGAIYGGCPGHSKALAIFTLSCSLQQQSFNHQ